MVEVPIDGYVLVVDAATELGVTPQQVRQLIRRGRIAAVKVNPMMYLVERASVEAYKRNRRPAGRPAQIRV